MKKIKKWLKVILFLFILWLLFFLPLPYYLEVPGTVFSLEDMIEVDGQFKEDSTDFYITTVGIKQLTPLSAMRSFFPYQDLVKESDLFGGVTDFESYNNIQQYHMDNSINNAIKAAFDAAGKEYDLTYEGVYVLQILEDSNFIDKIKIGDLIKSVDNHEIRNTDQLVNYIKDKKVGEKITLKVDRSGEEKVFSAPLIKSDSGVTSIGIGLTDKSKIITKPSVKIHSADIGGPSAGLMFSLEVFTQISDTNIQDNYNIAGTGTISIDGKVGRIGGIDKKVVAADREGADYFLAPDDDLVKKDIDSDINRKSNYDLALETAKEIKSDMIVVPIKDLEDAIEFIEKLGEQENISSNNKKIPDFHPINSFHFKNNQIVAK